MENFIKSWKTTLIGVLMICMSIYHYFTTGDEINWAVLSTALIGIGFFVSKDSSDSHTKR